MEVYGKQVKVEVEGKVKGKVERTEQGIARDNVKWTVMG